MVLKLRCSWSSPVTLGWVTWKLPCGSQVHVSLPHLNPSFYPLWHCFLKHIIPFIYVNELSFLPLNNFFFKWNYTVFYFLFIFFTQWKAGPPSLKLLMSNSSSKIVRGISFIFLKAIENGKRVRKPLLKIIFFSCVWKWREKYLLGVTVVASCRRRPLLWGIRPHQCLLGPDSKLPLPGQQHGSAWEWGDPQSEPQTHWARVCAFTRSLGDLYVH